MSREDVLNNYQEDATEAKGPSMSEKEKQEREQVREQVLETLSSPGYGLLHKMFVDRVQEASARLTAGRTLTIDQIRFEQGIIEGIRSVQSRFVALSKKQKEEEED